MALHLRKIAVRAWVTALSVILGLILVLALGTAWLLGTESGRLFLVDQAEAWLPRLTGQQLETRDVSSPTLGEWNFGYLSWRAGPDGPRVELEALELDWEPRYALQRRIWIDRLAARTVNIRLPEPSEETPEPDSSASTPLTDIKAIWPRIPPVHVQDLAIDQLNVERPGWPLLSTSVSSQLALNWGSWPARVNLNLAHNRSELNLDVTLDAVDALRVTGNVSSAANSNWAQWLQWPMEEDIVGEWDILLRDEGSSITAAIDRFAVPWRGYQLGVEGGLSYGLNNGRVFFSELDLTVDGSSARLHGYVEARRADLGIAAKEIPLSLLNGLIPVEDLTGALTVEGRLTGGWQQPRFQGQAGFEGSLQDAPLRVSTRSSATPDGVALDSLTANWGEASLTASGEVEWAREQLDLAVQWSGLKHSHWQPWVPAWPADLTLSTQGKARISGRIDNPDVNGTLNADGHYRQQPLRLNAEITANLDRVNLTSAQLVTDLGEINGVLDLNLTSLAFAARTEFSDISSDWLTIAEVDLPVPHDLTANGELDWSGTLTDPLAEGWVGLEGSWQQRPLNARLAIESVSMSQLTLGDSQLSLAEAEAQIAGQVDWKAREVDLDGEVSSLRLGTFRPFLTNLPPWLEDLTGTANGTLALNGPWLQPRLAADLMFDGQWQSRPLRANMKVESTDREQWQVDRAELSWGEANLSYEGVLRPFEPAISGEYSINGLRVADILALPMVEFPAELKDLEGALQASGSIKGPLTAPVLSTRADFQGQWQETPLALNINLKRLTTSGVQVEAARLDSGEASLSLAGEVQFQPLTLGLDAELVQLSWAQVKPFVPETLDLPFSTLEGRTSGQVRADGQWPSLKIEGHLDSRGEYLNQAYNLDWNGSGNLGDELQHQISLNWGEARLEGRVNNQRESISGELRLVSFRIEQIRALGAPLGEGITGEVNAHIEIAGDMRDPNVVANIDAGGRWQPPDNGSFEEPWSLTVAARGDMQEWQVTDAQADLGQAGSLEITGEGTRQRVSLSGNLKVDDTAYWLGEQTPWSGGLSGRFEVSGTRDEPSIAADFDWQSDRWPVAVALNLTTKEGQHNLVARVTEDQTERVKVDLRTEQTPLAEWGEDISQRTFAADLDLNADSTVFAPLLQERPDQDFTGLVRGQLSIRGTLSEPEWEGEARLSQGRYENASYGTVLANMEATLKANNRTLDLDMKATDANGGRVTLAGAVVWPEDRDEWWMPELDMALNTRNAHLVRRADIDASVSGELTVQGPWRDLLVAGELNIIPLTIQLDSLLQTGTPTLNVVRGSVEKEEEDDAAALTSSYTPAGRWDVRVRADRRAQIYGQGLEAELSGVLDITDELDSPNIGGRFEVIRGIYTAFGKVFRITRGNIQVQGSQILLDIVAVYNGPELQRVELHVSGNQERLDLTLTSTPALANEELLARLLFGKRIEEMTPVQAFQLASALNSLRDPGGGLDLFGTTRNLLGLDTLTVDTATNEEGESGVNVAAGKYLSDRLYLQVESDSSTEQFLSGSLQFQITPQVNLELYSRGMVGSGGLELNWSNDY